MFTWGNYLVACGFASAALHYSNSSSVNISPFVVVGFVMVNIGEQGKEEAESAGVIVVFFISFLLLMYSLIGTDDHVYQVISNLIYLVITFTVSLYPACPHPPHPTPPLPCVSLFVCPYLMKPLPLCVSAETVDIDNINAGCGWLRLAGLRFSSSSSSPSLSSSAP